MEMRGTTTLLEYQMTSFHLTHEGRRLEKKNEKRNEYPPFPRVGFGSLKNK